MLASASRNFGISRLMTIARERLRPAWYMLALLAGLRLSELRKLTWGDIRLERGVLTIGMGKAMRLDEVPLDPELAAAIAAPGRRLSRMRARQPVDAPASPGQVPIHPRSQ